MCQKKVVDPREFAAVLGRLGFASSALPWEKPFLGPLYVWSSATRGQAGRIIVPWAVLAILDWLARRLKTGGRMEEVRWEPPRAKGEAVFYTDARASEEDACIGGYLKISEDLTQCPWFSIEVTEELAPWMRSKGGNPKRVIAALELLATLVAVKLWGSKFPGGLKGKMKAFTDNRGNAFALAKGMSTKFPLTILLMELAEELRCLNMRLDLEWLRREENVQADALSNGDWSLFDTRLREGFEEKKIVWRVLGEVQQRGEELYKEVQALKEERRLANAAKGSRAAKKGKTKVLPKMVSDWNRDVPIGYIAYVHGLALKPGGCRHSKKENADLLRGHVNVLMTGHVNVCFSPDV